MKKILAMVLTLCLLLGTTALAADNTVSGTDSDKDKTANTTINVTVDESYTVVIPSEVNIPFNQLNTNLPIEVTSLRLRGNTAEDNEANRERRLYVKASCGHYGFYLKNEADEQLYVDLTGDEQEGYVTFNSTGTKNLGLGITQDRWNSASAGTYTAQITFSFWFAYHSK